MPPKSGRGELKNYRKWLGAFPSLRVGVIGDFAADHYVVGMTSRISREAPVLILKKREEFVLPGQAGNSAANLAALGVKCVALGFVGDDREGGALVRALAERGVDTSGIVKTAEGGTIVKTRILSGAHHTTLQQVIRIDDDEALRIGAADRQRLAEIVRRQLPTLDAILVSDYGYGTASPALWRMLRSRKGRGPVLVVDSRYGLRNFKGADVITPNETEVFGHLGIKHFAGTDPAQAGGRLVKATRCRGLVMTRGNEGMIVFAEGATPRAIEIFGSREVTDVTGAGDTVAAVISAVRAAGGPLIEAASLANVAAGLAVMKRGAATVSPSEILAALAPSAR